MRSKRLIGAVAGVLVVVGGAIAVVQSGVSEVASVRVQGDNVLDPVALRRASGIAPGMNAMSLDLDAAVVRLEEMPLVESATVEREGALGVLITIVERRPALIIVTPFGRRAVDRDAVVMDLPPAPIALPELRLDRISELEASTVRASLRLWGRFTAGERRRAGVSWGAVHGLSFDLGSMTVLVGDGDELEAKLAVFREVRHSLGKGLRRIDLTQLPRIGVIA